jgi:hypothetical protein
MIPVLDIEPFCLAFFDAPYPGHAAMRETGPAVHRPAIRRLCHGAA